MTFQIRRQPITIKLHVQNILNVHMVSLYVSKLYDQRLPGLSTSGTKSNTNPEKTIVVETITHPNQFIDLSMSLQEKPEIQE